MNNRNVLVILLNKYYLFSPDFYVVATVIKPKSADKKGLNE